MGTYHRIRSWAFWMMGSSFIRNFTAEAQRCRRAGAEFLFFEAENFAADTLFEERDVEVYQESDLPAAESQVG